MKSECNNCFSIWFEDNQSGECPECKSGDIDYSQEQMCNYKFKDVEDKENAQ